MIDLLASIDLEEGYKVYVGVPAQNAGRLFIWDVLHLWLEEKYPSISPEDLSDLSFDLSSIFYRISMQG